MGYVLSIFQSSYGSLSRERGHVTVIVQPISGGLRFSGVSHPLLSDNIDTIMGTLKEYILG